MPEIGPLEILVIAVVALIVFGPEKLPEMGRKVGSFLAGVRRMSTEVRSEFTGLMDDDDDPFSPEDESATAASRADEEGEPGEDNDEPGEDDDDENAPRARIEG